MPYPTCYTVETVCGCNLSCPICACGSDKLTRPRAHMSLEQYQHIASKIRPHAKMVMLHNWGEPLLNKSIYDMIELTQEFATPNIHTNGNMRADCERLARSGADIVVSLDAVSQKTYEIYRRGGSLAQALTTLLLIALYRREFKPPRAASLHAQILLFEHNQHELVDLVGLLQSLDVAHIIKVPQLAMNPVLMPSTLREFPPRKSVTRESIRRCRNVDHDMVILVDGSVVPCCYDYNGSVVFGNIFEQTVEEIWDSEGYRDFRSRIEVDAPEFCLENCLDGGEPCTYTIRV